MKKFFLSPVLHKIWKAKTAATEPSFNLIRSFSLIKICHLSFVILVCVSYSFIEKQNDIKKRLVLLYSAFLSIQICNRS